ncbi:MAG: lipoyl synthase [Desulfamplus sp.]|nr:lipoyl synthase [Desulfamplus sp.]
MQTKQPREKKPVWLKRNLPTGSDFEKVRQLLSKASLHTVCQEAKCPNMWECFSRHTSTFMIMGDLCTRNCRFCNVKTGAPLPLDPDEPKRVANAALELGLKYVVITSVTRDDLEDGGSSHFAQTIGEIKKLSKSYQIDAQKQVQKIKVEVLIPDFQGDLDGLKVVIDAKPDVLNHNIETVPSLYPQVRPEAIYQRSLELIERASNINRTMPVKSGIMVGLGETKDELKATIIDLYNHGCKILTIGQYLQPSAKHLPVVKFYEPKEFDELKEFAESVGFKSVASAPFVRSSYQADKLCCG